MRGKSIVAWWRKFVTENMAPRYRVPKESRKEPLLPRPHWAPFHTEVPGSMGLRTETPGEKLMREAHDYEATVAAKSAPKMKPYNSGTPEETRARVKDING